MQPPTDLGAGGLEERIEALCAWVGEIADRVQATELATGDEKTAKELRRALEAVAKHDPRLEGRLTDRIDVLTDRVGTLASAVSTTSSELARRDGEIAALRREVDRGSAQVQAFEQEVARGAPAAELETLRKAVATLAVEQSPRKDDEQVARLGGKVDYLTERVDTLAKTVAATAAGLAGRDGDLATLRQKLDERTKRLELELAELAQRPEVALGGRLEVLEAAVQQSVAALAAQDEALVTRLDAVAMDVESTSTGLAEKHAAVERILAEALTGSAREAARTSELERGLAELSGRQEKAERALAGERDERATEIARASRAVRDHLSGLAERTKRLELDLAELEQRPEVALGGRLDVLEAQVQESIAGLAAQDAGTEALRQAWARSLDAHAASQNSKHANLVAQLDAVATDVESTTTGLEEKHAAVERTLAEALTGSAREAARTSELEHRFAEVAGRQETAERALSGARDELTAEVGRASNALAEQLSGLAERIDMVELLGTTDAAELARVKAESASKLEEVIALDAELRSVAESVAEASRRTESAGQELADLEERLRAVEQAGVDARAENARVSASWAAELERIAARVDDASASARDATSSDAHAELLTELNARLAAIVHDRDAVAAQIAKASENEVAELRGLIDGFRTRLAPDPGSTGGPPHVGGGLDEPARRLDSTENVGPEQDAESGPGEGRVRLELRALELRAERAETAARQNRDAMVAQLDRLAGQIESRFQKLESDPADAPHSEEVGQAEVVPLRGAEV